MICLLHSLGSSLGSYDLFVTQSWFLYLRALARWRSAKVA